MIKRRSNPKIWDADWLVLRPLAKVITDQVQNYAKPSAKIVDFGCGDMPYKPIFENFGLEYIGADLDEGADLVIDDNGQIPLQARTADAVLSSQVLEHVRDIESYCSEIQRILTNDGTLFLSTHGAWLYHPHPGDYRRWTRTGLITDLEANGFVVDEIISIVGPLATTTLIRLTGFVFFLRKLPFAGPVLGKILSTLMNIRAYLEDAATPESIRENDACVYFVRARLQTA